MKYKSFPWIAVAVIVVLFSIMISLMTWVFLGFISGVIFPALTAYSSVLSIIFILSFMFWLWMLVDSLRREYKKENDKFVWVMVIIFTWLIGAFLYYFMVKYAPPENTSQKRRKK